MKLNFLIVLVFVISCTARQGDNSDKPHASIDTVPAKPVLPHAENSSTAIVETFTDSLHIGEKGRSKVELIKHRVLDDIYVIVKFYTRGADDWLLQNTYLYECDAMMGLYPTVADFNNDGFNDLTFISATAARGANEIERLFVYDDSEMSLISIVNSQEFPNMHYNKELDCIDAFLVYGGSSTVFARIQGDSLKEFARVDNDEFRTVVEIDQNGNEKLLRRDPIKSGDVYTRYLNYNPLKPYGE